MTTSNILLKATFETIDSKPIGNYCPPLGTGLYNSNFTSSVSQNKINLI